MPACLGPGGLGGCGPWIPFWVCLPAWVHSLPFTIQLPPPYGTGYHSLGSMHCSTIPGLEDLPPAVHHLPLDTCRFLFYQSGYHLRLPGYLMHFLFTTWVPMPACSCWDHRSCSGWYLLLGLGGAASGTTCTITILGLPAWPGRRYLLPAGRYHLPFLPPPPPLPFYHLLMGLPIPQTTTWVIWAGISTCSAISGSCYRSCTTCLPLPLFCFWRCSTTWVMEGTCHRTCMFCTIPAR